MEQFPTRKNEVPVPALVVVLFFSSFFLVLIGMGLLWQLASTWYCHLRPVIGLAPSFFSAPPPPHRQKRRTSNVDSASSPKSVSISARVPTARLHLQRLVHEATPHITSSKLLPLPFQRSF